MTHTGRRRQRSLKELREDFVLGFRRGAVDTILANAAGIAGGRHLEVLGAYTAATNIRRVVCRACEKGPTGAHASAVGSNHRCSTWGSSSRSWMRTARTASSRQRSSSRTAARSPARSRPRPRTCWALPSRATECGRVPGRGRQGCASSEEGLHVNPYPALVVALVGVLLYLQKPGPMRAGATGWRSWHRYVRYSLADLGRLAFVVGLAWLLLYFSPASPRTRSGCTARRWEQPALGRCTLERRRLVDDGAAIASSAEELGEARILADVRGARAAVRPPERVPVRPVPLAAPRLAALHLLTSQCHARGKPGGERRDCAGGRRARGPRRRRRSSSAGLM